MNPIEWLSDEEFRVGGVKFLSGLRDYSLKTNDERIVILKDLPSLELYKTVFAGVEPRNVLEFGIFQGGSPALFSLWLDVEKFVGIDLCDPVQRFDAFCARHPIGKKIRSYYGTSQTDKQRIDQIVAAEFGDKPLDLIIDDASHLYEETRRTFEIAFPYLKPDGIYVVEDWGWAHWPGSKVFMGKTAMSIFIMELIMLCASRSDLIREVRVFPPFAFIQKAPGAPALPDMKLDSLYTKRGLEIVSSGEPVRAGIAGVVGERLRRQVARITRSIRKRVVRNAS
jgi:cephalosporin hydroxylase